MGQSSVGCLQAPAGVLPRSHLGCHSSADYNSCKAAVGRHLLEAECPFEAADFANCALLTASRDGDVDAIQKALKAGADVNTRLPPWMRHGPKNTNECARKNPDTLGLTPLMHACNEGQVEAVKLLLGHSAEIGLRETDGMQAIHFAAEAASAACFLALLEAGADPFATDNFDRSALECVPRLLDTSSCSVRQEWQAVFQQVNMDMSPRVAASGEAFGGNSVAVSEVVAQAAGYDDDEGKEVFTSSTYPEAQTAVDDASLMSVEKCDNLETGVGQMSVGSASTTASFDAS